MKVRLARQVRRRSAFTLLEILIVLAIIGVIAAMAVPRLLGQQRGALIQTTKTAITNLEKSAELWAVGNLGSYPESIQAMMQKGPDGSEPIYTKVPADAWNQPLNYEYPSTRSESGRPAIWSNGENRTNENGGGDDINNWSEATK
ncbi:type II secretion system protein GspG [Planctomicrobium sp. SH527]|uniref:type II secretion system protein GspG n=1 Tax=Planctomicrobium sp. SH527 TaxID=3448123 RepID=UPI003F5C6BB5